MNGKFSLLSAAVLLALAGTSADATQATPTAASSPARNPARAHFKAPLGSTVLYDQTLTGSNAGIVSQNFSSANVTADSAGADDFVVTDASGWTVSTINVEGQYFNGPGPADSFNVNIYPDAGGLPGAVAACTYTALPYSTTGTTPTVAFSIPLSSPCGLAQGTYWVSAVANMNFTAPHGEFGWNAYLPATVPGATAKWQNPANGLATGCTTWGELPTCLAPNVTENSFSFQIVGHTGNSGGIALAVSLAEDNGNPTQCGTSTSLSATVGDQINFCYTVTNNTTFTLNYQSLADTVTGAIFTFLPQVIAPGASFQYNRIVTAGASESPTSTWTAQDALPGYSNSAGSQTFVDISGTGTPITPPLGDDGSAAVVMPFSFNFYGATSNQLCVNNNGNIHFAAAGSCSGFFGNAALPYSVFTDSVIMPFWDDLFTGGNVFTQTIGTTPNQQFIVEYFDKDTFGNPAAPPGYTFEAIFNEVDGSIDFNYATVTSGGSPANDGGLSATVGLQQNTTVANQYSFDTASLTDGQNIHWVPSNPNVFTASQTVTLDVGQPTIFVIPNPLADTAAAGSSVTTPLYLLNTGNRDLNWTVDEFSPTAHFPLVPAFVVPFHSKEETHAGPVPRAKRMPGQKTHPQIPFAQAVPAFGETFSASGLNYVNFDASAPGTLNTVATFTDYFFAGTFVNNDFTTEYAVDYPAGDLYTIDTTSGAQTLVGDTGQGTGVTGIRWDATTGTTFLMASACGTSSTLYTLDLATGATTPVGSSSGNCIIDIAIDPSGLMYGVDIIADTLVAIDKTTGAAAVIGSIGFNSNFAQGMDFDAATGILYFAGVDAGAGNAANMYTIDTTTGLATLISPIGPAPGLETDAFAIAVASGPSCSTPTDVPWLSESPTSGTATAGLYSTVDVTMDATALTPGPYSATVCVHSNDPTNRTVKVPVTFTVTAPVVTDRIFADGFDGP